MRRAIMILTTALLLTADATACGLLDTCRQRVQARRDARSAKATPVTACRPAPTQRPAYLPETLPAFAPPATPGPVATASRRCAGASCPK